MSDDSFERKAREWLLEELGEDGLIHLHSLMAHDRSVHNEAVEKCAARVEREHPNHGGPQDAEMLRALRAPTEGSGK